MKVTPKTEDELKAINLIPEGIYNFEVLEAVEKLSKSNNEMIELKLGIWDDNGNMRVIFDYLLDAMEHKLRHFCVITKNMERYDSKNLLPEHCIGNSGKVHLIIQKGKDKPDGTKYPDRNSVQDYVLSDTAVEVKKDEFINFINDDLAF